MLDISKDEFLRSMADQFLADSEPGLGDIRDRLEKVWEQAAGQALVDHEERTLQHNFGKAVMSNGGPEEVAKRIGVSTETVKRWVVRPLDMHLSEIRRFQHATGLSMHFEVLEPIDKGD